MGLGSLAKLIKKLFKSGKSIKSLRKLGKGIVGARKLKKAAETESLLAKSAQAFKRTGTSKANLKNALKYRAYLREIEKKTGRKIPRNQIRELKNAIKNGDYSKPLDKKAYEDHTTDYYKQRDKMRDEWSQKTDQEWPKYKEDVYSKNGKPYLYEGDNYDLHHIIERKYGGPNTWWNSHPASNPIEHQAGIHGSGSIAKELFP